MKNRPTAKNGVTQRKMAASCGLMRKDKDGKKDKDKKDKDKKPKEGKKEKKGGEKA